MNVMSFQKKTGEFKGIHADFQGDQEIPFINFSHSDLLKLFEIL